MFFRRLNWNVVGWFRIVSAISYVIIGLGIAMMIFNLVRTGAPLRLGLSFTGGTDITVAFTKPVTQPQLVAGLKTVGVTDAQVNSAKMQPTPGKDGSAGTLPNEGWTVETQHDFGNDSTPIKSMLNGLAPVNWNKSSISTVGPSLSHEYLTSALEALVIAITIQFVYIAFRFGWNYIFGVVAVVALVRDSLMMIGIYALAGKEVDDAFLAAVLTVIGYSVMDTIVILDRIRENTKIMESEAYEKIVNTSILQTMTRSVNTLATVVITLVALLALGGASLKNFAFALLVGICSGGYHSIFYSAPLVLVFRKRQLAAAARKRAAGLSTDRTRTARAVAESKALGAHAGVAREDIVAARKARREKAKATRAPAPVAPARYKRKRTDGTAAGAAASTAVEDAPGAFEEIDPLEAQASGLHDEACDQGHEAITLHLDEFEPEQTLPPRDEPAQPQGE